MAVHTQTSSSPLALPESIRYYIERNPGNMLIPLIPIDQLPLHLEGVPSRLSKQQISEENWQRVSGVTETAVLLPAQLLTPHGTFTMTPTFPTYRAPDYNVKKHAAVQDPEKDEAPKPFPVFNHPNTNVKPPESEHQRHSARKDGDSDTHLAPVSLSTDPSWIVQRSRAMTTGTHDDKSWESITPTRTNNHAIPLRSAPLPDITERAVAREASNSIVPEARPETHRPLFSRADKGHSTAKDNDGDKLWFPGPRLSPMRPHLPPKTHCNHWIQYGECAYGDRCLYKHEMPSLDVLKRVTGFMRIPQWYKEQTAIQSRGPTWVERNMQAKKQNAGRGDGKDMPGPREFPDPSTFKSLLREQDGVAKQNVLTSRTVQNLIELVPPASHVDPVGLAKPTSPMAQHLAVSTPLTETEKEKGAPTILRRNSQISSSSGTTSSSQNTTQRYKPKSSFKKAQQNSPSQPKWGLAASKYAPENEPVALDACSSMKKARPGRDNKSSTREEGHVVETMGTGQRTAVEVFLL